MTIHDLVNLLVDYAQTDGSFEEEIKFLEQVKRGGTNGETNEYAIREIKGITTLDNTGTTNAILYSVIN